MNLRRLLAAGAIAALALLPTSTALAQQSACNETVLDETGTFLNQAKLAQITQAAQETNQALNNAAVLRVRVLKDYAGQTNYTNWLNLQLRNVCTSWSDGRGGRAPGLLLYTFNRQTNKGAFTYGRNWEGPLNSTWRGIVDNDLDPLLMSGNPDGFLRALESTRRVSSEFQQRTGQAPPAPAPLVQQPAAPPGPPPDYSWAGPTGLTVAGLLTIAALVAYLLSRQNMAATARKAKSQANVKVTETDDEISLAKKTLKSLEGSVAANELRPHSLKLDEATGLATSASEHLRGLQGNEFDPSKRHWNIGTYVAIASAYNEVIRILDRAKNKASEVRSSADHLAELVNKIPQWIEETAALIAAADAEIDQVRTEGFRVQPQEDLLIQAEAHLTLAKSTFSEQQISKTEGHLQAARRDQQEARDQALKLKKRRDAITQGVQRLTADLSAVRVTINDSISLLRDLRRRYNLPANEELVPSSPDSVSQVLSAAESSIERAGMLATMERQEWEQAETTLAEAKKRIDAASSYPGQVNYLAEFLRKAPDAITETLRQADNDVKRAEGYSSRYTGRSKELLKDELASISGQIEEARQALGRRKPNLFALTRDAQELRTAVGQAIKSATEVYHRDNPSYHRTESATFAGDGGTFIYVSMPTAPSHYGGQPGGYQSYSSGYSSGGGGYGGDGGGGGGGDGGGGGGGDGGGGGGGE